MHTSIHGYEGLSLWLHHAQGVETIYSSNSKLKLVWSKLFKVFLVDWVICVVGVLGTGVLFVVIFNFAH